MSTTKLRAQHIAIDIPTETAEAWVSAVLQKVIKDDEYKTIQLVDRTDYLHRKFSEFALQMLPFTDPVTQQQITLSGAGLAVAISTFVKTWMLAGIHGTVENAHGDIIKETTP